MRPATAILSKLLIKILDHFKGSNHQLRYIYWNKKVSAKKKLL